MINKIVHTFNEYFSTLNRSQKIFSILLIIFTFTLPYSAKSVTVSLIILLVFTWLFSAMPYKNYKLLINNLHRKIILSFSLLFIIYFLGFLFPSEIEYKRAILIKLPILFFPLIFSTLDKELYNRNFFKILLNVFVFGVLTTLIILTVRAVINYQITNDIREFFYVKFTSKDHHPTYLAMFVVFAFIISLHQFIEQKKVKSIFLIPILVFVFYLILISSKAGILSYFTLLSLGIIYFLFNYRKNIFVIISSILLIIYGLGLYKALPIAQKRMEIAEKALNLDNNERVNSTDGSSVRILVWLETIKLIKEKPFFGYGTGNERKMLKTSEVLISSESINESEVWPDSHSQFLQTLLSVGFIGFLFLGYIVFISLRMGLKYKDYLLLALIFLSSINWLFESMLDKQAGLIFFSFFLCLLFMNIEMKSEKKSIDSISD